VLAAAGFSLWALAAEFIRAEDADAAAYEGTPLPHYRVHILDPRGDLLGAVDLDCTDDEAAIEHIKDLLDDHDAELWRLVEVFGPNGSAKH
jgi:hypothetical protein